MSSWTKRSPPINSLTPEMVEKIVDQHILGGDPVEEWLAGPEYEPFHRKQEKIVLAQCGRIDPEDIEAYLAVGGYQAAGKALSSMTPDQVIQEIKKRDYGVAAGRASPPASNGKPVDVPGRSEIYYLQCRRGRSRRLHGPRGDRRGSPRRDRRDDYRRLCHGSTPKGSFISGRNIPWPLNGFELALAQAREQ